MNYEEAGFNQFFRREEPTKKIEVADLPEISTEDFGSLFQEVSGSKIRGGVLRSRDGRLTIDLENGKMTYNNGVVDLFTLGGTDREMTLKNTDNVVELDEEP